MIKCTNLSAGYAPLEKIGRASAHRQFKIFPSKREAIQNLNKESIRHVKRSFLKNSLQMNKSFIFFNKRKTLQFLLPSYKKYA